MVGFERENVKNQELPKRDHLICLNPKTPLTSQSPTTFFLDFLRNFSDLIEDGINHPLDGHWHLWNS
ncbi:hypothetical protein L1987_45214 [Smallanthus sonchifolius]|uniref:Uncharacterized protein n=1 Tax=Smallanthus sonchifolius TaxID=185202 RepID=A0ACB9GTR6_9ASTR|nr:hypothetical protein L1987_45214 [Smallanthus sonchifolius]